MHLYWPTRPISWLECLLLVKVKSTVESRKWSPWCRETHVQGSRYLALMMPRGASSGETLFGPHDAERCMFRGASISPPWCRETHVQGSLYLAPIWCRETHVQGSLYLSLIMPRDACSGESLFGPHDAERRIFMGASIFGKMFKSTETSPTHTYTDTTAETLLLIEGGARVARRHNILKISRYQPNVGLMAGSGEIF